MVEIKSVSGWSFLPSLPQGMDVRFQELEVVHVGERLVELALEKKVEQCQAQ